VLLGATATLVSSCGRAVDWIRGAGLGPPNRTIAPGKSIYGVPMGASKERFIRRCGRPTGELQLANGELLLIYGVKHAFFFRDDRLVGVCVWTSPILLGPINWVLAPSRFDEVSWRLSNGITNYMTLKDVKAILKERLVPYGGSPDHWDRQYFRENGMRVELQFGICFPKEESPVAAILAKAE